MIDLTTLSFLYHMHALSKWQTGEVDRNRMKVKDMDVVC